MRVCFNFFFLNNMMEQKIEISFNLNYAYIKYRIQGSTLYAEIEHIEFLLKFNM